MSLEAQIYRLYIIITVTEPEVDKWIIMMLSSGVNCVNDSGCYGGSSGDVGGGTCLYVSSSRSSSSSRKVSRVGCWESCTRGGGDGSVVRLRWWSTKAP